MVWLGHSEPSWPSDPFSRRHQSEVLTWERQPNVAEEAEKPGLRIYPFREETSSVRRISVNHMPEADSPVQASISPFVTGDETSPEQELYNTGWEPNVQTPVLEGFGGISGHPQGSAPGCRTGAQRTRDPTGHTCSALLGEAMQRHSLSPSPEPWQVLARSS